MVNLFTWMAWISTGLFSIFILFMFVGGVSHSLDFDIDGDGVADGHDFSGFKILTIQGLSAFGMGFGWMGKAAVLWGWNQVQVVGVSFVAGSAMLALMTIMMRQLKRLDETPIRNLHECVGKSALAYTPLSKNSIGKIEVSLNGRKQIVDARNSSERYISSFETVQVSDLGSDGILVIR